jgi:hypothetical protein
LFNKLTLSFKDKPKEETMKKIKIIVTMLIFVSLFINAEDKKFGSDVTLTDKTEVKAILENPAEYEGKKVLVEGTIVGVCESRGCWIEIAAAEGYEKIRVKVDDGVIVFPMEAKGKQALVEGEVYAVTPATSCSGTCSDHEKKEGDECEHETAKVYQIKGLGAVVKM